MTKTSKNRGKNIAESSAPAAHHSGSDEDSPQLVRHKPKRAKKGAVEQPAKKKTSVAERVERLKKMAFKQTRWADHQTLRDLGIFEEVSVILNRMGLLGLFNMNHHAYREETIQFLATLTVNDDTSLDISDENRGRISFKIRGRRYGLTFAQLASVFHFRPGGQVYSLSLDWKEAQGVWSEIASGQFTKGISKASLIRHPALRYVHKFLAHTLFARRETGAVKEEELALITEAIKPILQTTALSGEIVGQPKELHLAHYFARRLQHFQEWSATNYDHTPILNMGGLITPILLASGVTIHEDEQAIHPSRLDMHHLCATKFIRGRVRRSYAYEFNSTTKEKKIILLPCNQSTFFGERTNITFKPRIFLLYDPRVEGPIKNLKSSQGADEDEDMEQPAEIFGSKRYDFPLYAGPVTGEALQKAHEHIGILSRAMKWQQKQIKKLYRKGKKQAKLIKELFTQTGKTPAASLAMVTTEQGDEAEGSTRRSRQRKGKAPIPVSSSSSDSGNPSYNMDDSSDAASN